MENRSVFGRSWDEKFLTIKGDYGSSGYTTLDISNLRTAHQIEQTLHLVNFVNCRSRPGRGPAARRPRPAAGVATGRLPPARVPARRGSAAASCGADGVEGELLRMKERGAMMVSCEAETNRGTGTRERGAGMVSAGDRARRAQRWTDRDSERGGGPREIQRKRERQTDRGVSNQLVSTHLPGQLIPWSHPAWSSGLPHPGPGPPALRPPARHLLSGVACPTQLPLPSSGEGFVWPLT